MISLGSIIICVLTSMVLALYLYIIIYKNAAFSRGIKLVFIGFMIVLIRLLIPINFFFTITIPVKHILPDLAAPLFIPIGRTNMFHILLLIWVIGALFKIGLQVVRYRKNYVYCLQCQGMYKDREEQIRNILKENGAAHIRTAILPSNISPSIMGFRSPLLILPNQLFSDKELRYIIKHEVEHYKNHDLWLKAIVEMAACVYWWNPFMYLLKSSLYLTMELSNDMVVINDLEDTEKLEYAACLVGIAKTISVQSPLVNAVPFIYSKSDLKIRILRVMKAVKTKKKKTFGVLLVHLCITVVMILCSFTFVLEAVRVPPEVEKESYEITAKTSYFVETEEGYKLFVDGKYFATVDEIEGTLQHLAIYKEDEIRE